MSFLITFLHLFYVVKYNASIRSFIRQKCLQNKSLACFGGKYRRNVFTMKEMYYILRNLLLFKIIYNSLIWCFQFEFDNKSSHRFNLFCIHNLVYLCFVDMYNIVFIPCRQIFYCQDSIWFSTRKASYVVRMNSKAKKN